VITHLRLYIHDPRREDHRARSNFSTGFDFKTGIQWRDPGRFSVHQFDVVSPNVAMQQLE
jgi:hypothetical protein